MDIQLIIKELKKYFDVRELISKAVWERMGESAWLLFDPRLLEVLLVLRRDVLCVPLVCNNWAKGGTMQQRGLRENVCPMVAEKTKAGKMYLSEHTMGRAVDLSAIGKTADEMRELIKQHASRLPYNIRVEDGESAPTWLHVDVRDTGQKVYFFKA